MGTNETGEEGFYNALLTPLSIIAGIQAAIMISQQEHGQAFWAEGLLQNVRHFFFPP